MCSGKGPEPPDDDVLENDAEVDDYVKSWRDNIEEERREQERKRRAGNNNGGTNSKSFRL